MDGTHYLDLFEVLDALADYDEDAVRTRFAGTMVDRHYAVVRHHLLNEILTCLHRMPAERGAVSTLHHEIDAVNFLLSRGCVTTAERRLRRAIGIAHRFELPSFIIDLCAIQRRALLVSPRVQRSILDEELTAIVALQDLHDATRMFDVIDRAYADHLLGSTAVVPSDLPLHAASLTHVARIRRERALWRLALIEHGWAEARPHVEATLQTIQACLDIADAHIVDVTDALLDIVDEASLHGAADVISGVRTIIDAIAGHELTSSASQRMLDIVAVHVSVADAVHGDGDLDEADVLTIRHDDDVRRHVPRRAAYAWGVRSAAIALANGDPGAALERVNELLNDTGMRGLAPRWYGQALLLNVMAHYALGNVDYVPYCVRGTLRKAERRRMLTTEECSLIRCIGQAAAKRLPLKDFDIPLGSMIRAWQDHASTSKTNTGHVARCPQAA